MANVLEQVEQLSPQERAFLLQRLKTKKSGAEQKLSIPRLPRADGENIFPLSFAQERMWFLDRLDGDQAVYSSVSALHIHGALDAAILEKSLNAVVQRYEILRSTFDLQDGRPVQRIAPALFLPLKRVDLSALPQALREEKAQDLLIAAQMQPFDLATGPMLRATLLRLGEGEHIFALCVHHILVDGWSYTILVRDLMKFYDAFSRNETPHLADLPIQYADFAAWQRQCLQGNRLDDLLAYWQKTLAGSLPVLQLPTDRPRPAIQTVRGASVRHVLPPSLHTGLRALSQKEGATLFMTLLAAFNVLLSRYSGQTDILVGTPIAGRSRVELEALIGFFINTLVLRSDLSGNPTFRQLMKRVREVTLSAYAHQDLPFEKLVEALDVPRDRSRNPLFQVLFILQNVPTENIQGADVKMLGVDIETQVAPFDLTVYFTETAQGLVQEINYNTDLFDRQTIERMLGHFQVLLEAVIAAPDQRLAALPLLTAAEQQQQRAWNATWAEFPRQVCLHELFEAQVTRTPHACAVVYGEPSENRSLTYRALNERANRLAHRLRKLGVGPEVLVGVCLSRTPDLIVAMLAILKAGGAYVPLDPAYPPQRNAFILEDTQAAVMLTEQALLPRLPEFSMQCLYLDREGDHMAGEPDTNPGYAALAHNLAYIIYTSGSTGRPKGVAIPHRSVGAFLAWAGRVFPPSCLDGVLAATSVCFDLSVYEIFLPLSVGGKVVLAENALQLPALAQRDEVKLINTVPSVMAELIRSHTLPASLRLVNLAGEALPQTLVEKIYGEYPQVEAVYNLYGPSEDTTYSTWACLAREASSEPPIGRPIANTQAYVLDAGLQPVPVGVAGELYLGGEGLARGYLNRPDGTAERFVPDPYGGEAGGRLYRTGDLCRYLPDGNLLYLGRLDHQVKLRGFRIELGEIEAALGGCAGVGECVVMAQGDGADRRLVAYLVAAGEPAPGVADLRTALKERLPEYMLPAAYVFLERFPLTPSGKIDRRALPAADAPQREVAYVAPRTAREEKLAGIWGDVLHVAQVGVHDNFFGLGGHSLLAISLIEQMRRAGLHTDVRTLFAHPTIAELAAAVNAEGDAFDVPANGIPASCEAITPEMLPLAALTGEEIGRIVAAVSGGVSNVQDIYPLSPLQEGILFHHLVGREGDIYLIPVQFAFESRERLERFVWALQRVIGRHDILRTAIVWDAVREPVQVVLRQASMGVEEVALDGAQGDASQQLSARYDPRRYRLDLRQAPLMRAFVAEDSCHGRWLLHLVFHHLIGDHTTLNVVVGEIGEILAGREASLPPALPYRDFVVQARLGVSQAEHEAFFRQMLATVDEPTAPFGLLDVRGDDFAGEEVRRVVDAGLAAGLHRQARRLGVSVASLLHLAWACVLARVSGREDVVFGTVLFGRMQGWEGVGRVVGMFINTLPVRIAIGEQGVAESVRQAHGLLVRLLRHEHASLALAQRCSGVKSPAPLFSALLNYRHTDGQEGAAMQGLEGVQIVDGEERTNYPLVLSVDDLGDGLALTVQTSSGVGAGRVCGYVHTALQQLVAALEQAPEMPAGRIEILPPAERQQVLVEWNRTQAAFPQRACLHELFEAQAARTPEALAASYEKQFLTYQELDQRSSRLARYLRRLGVGPGMLVGVSLERSLEMIVGLLGILKAGGTYVPLDPHYPGERLAYMLDDSAPQVLLTQHHLLAQLPASGAQAVCLDMDWPRIAQESDGHLAAAADPQDLAYVIYTSGSTGRPKGVGIPHRALVNFLESMRREPGMAGDDVLLSVTTLSFDIAGLELFLPLTCGARVIIASREMAADAMQLIDTLASVAITWMQATPATWRMLLAAGWQGKPGLKILSGGEALSPDLADGLLARCGELWNVYGPTETTIWSSACRVAGKAGVISIGKPIANTQLYVLDRRMNLLPVGVAGELYIGGAGLSHGYQRRAELTAEKFVPDPFGLVAGARLYRTGDLVRWLPDGTIEHLGRLDHQVKLRGFRIELGEIEVALRTCAGVRECVLVALGDGGDKRLVAYVVADQEPAPDVAALRQQLRQHLPEYMLPSAYVFLDQLPLTPSGKIDRKALPAPDATRPGLAKEFVAPRTPVEKQLSEIWLEVLKVERVGIHDDFFDLGGHSLLATQAMSHMRKAFQVDLPLLRIFETPTIAAIAEAIEQIQQVPAAKPSGIQRVSRQQYLLSSKQNSSSTPKVFNHRGEK